VARRRVDVGPGVKMEVQRSSRKAAMVGGLRGEGGRDVFGLDWGVWSG